MSKRKRAKRKRRQKQRHAHQQRKKHRRQQKGKNGPLLERYRAMQSAVEFATIGHLLEALR